MNGMLVTEKNYKSIAGKLHKFFSHKKFLCWHCFSGGMRKRISYTIKLPFEKEKFDTRRTYLDVKTTFKNHYSELPTTEVVGFWGPKGSYPFGLSVYFPV